MLKFKIRELLLSLDKRHPQTWLTKICNFTPSKANKLANNKQQSINLKDFSMLCHQLNCSPNDLLYWQNTTSLTLPPQHPCMVQLTPPDQEPEWRKILGSMRPDEVLELKKIAEEKIKNRNKG